MNSRDEILFRLRLADGFLSEAEQDIELGRWRSCVDNSQLCVENSGKAVLALLNLSPKTHDPAQHIASALRSQPMEENIRQKILELLPEFLALGGRDHFMTDYGDEATYTLPWDLFDRDAAESALKTARICLSGVRDLLQTSGS